MVLKKYLVESTIKPRVFYTKLEKILRIWDDESVNSTKMVKAAAYIKQMYDDDPTNFEVNMDRALDEYEPIDYYM